MSGASFSGAAPEKTNALFSHNKIHSVLPQGLYHSMAIITLIIWYITSGATLFSNKYILSHLMGRTLSLGANQLVISVISGSIQLHINNRYKCQPHRSVPMSKKFLQDIILIGAFRCATIILGLVSLKYIAVSFVATIKSSSPLFTVMISRIMLREKTSNWTKFSMVTITIGLFLCSSFELSFNLFGFLCALGTNIFDCLQNVYSKLLICGEHYRYTAAELQFWASFVACILQAPFLIYCVDIPTAMKSTSNELIVLYICNGIFYHIQSVAAFAIMAYISPITHSVANTVKRALLIWLSILIFHNPVTHFSAFGTLVVILGVILYNCGRDMEKKVDPLIVDRATTIA